MTSPPSDRPRPQPGVELPDLEGSGDAGIVAENIRAMGPIIVAAMFEELKLGPVVDRIAEQFQRGALPIGRRSMGRAFYRPRRNSPKRMCARERRRLEVIICDAMSKAASQAVRRLSDRDGLGRTRGSPG